MNLLLDSGAYSAWSKQTTIDIDLYIAYIKENAEYIDVVVNLDRIPGEYGRIPTAEEVEQSAQESWDNLLYMEQEGIRAMPVYHQGERIYWLEKMIESGYDYIGISPANDRTTDQKIAWLDYVFDNICDAEGWPQIKTHGFGVTALPILFRYPWWSADSTSWIMFGAYGIVLVPQRHLTALRYDVSPFLVFISKESKRQNTLGKHYRSFSPSVQAYIKEYIESLDFTIAELEASYFNRDRFNAKFFLEVEKNKPNLPFKRSRKGFFV